MRTKTCARPRFSKSSRRSSLPTTARSLPSPIPDNISDGDGSTDLVENYNSSENGGSASGDSVDDKAAVKTCLKCNEGEHLLVCSGSGCVIVVHDKCLASEPKYDKKGNFYCPYCWCKLLEARAKASLKKAMLAKKDLQAFMAVKPLVSSTKDKQDDVRTRGNNPNVSRNAGENDQCEHVNSMDVNDEVPSGTGKVEKQHQIDSNLKLPDKSTGVVERERISETHACEILEVEGSMGKERDDQQVVDEKDGEINANEVSMGKERDDPQVVDEKDGGINANEVSMGKERDDPQVVEEKNEEINANEVSMGKERDDQQVVDEKVEEINANEVSMEKENDNHQVIDEKVEGINAKEVGIKGKTDNQLRRPQVHAEKSIPLKKRMQSQVPANRSTKLSFAHEKRKRLHWSPEEEDMLREGVETFSGKVNKNIPWRKILELGRHIFDSSRTPSDLKDKWRSIVAKESSAANMRSP